jgi:hypothetical protein
LPIANRIRRNFALSVFAAALVAVGGCGADDTKPVNLDDSSREPRNLDKRIEDAERRLRRLQEGRSEPRAPRTTVGLRGAEDFLASLNAKAGVTAGPPGADEPETAGDLTSGPAWSTIKVPIALRVLDRAGGVSALGDTKRSQIESAITRSDNGAAARLFASLGSTAEAAADVQDVLRQAGDDETHVSTEGRGEFSPYGQTDWALARQHRFMAALAGGCLGDKNNADYLLSLMGAVTSDTWGLGSAGGPAKWKGGWGPGPEGRYLVRQMGVIEFGSRKLVVTLAAIPHDGQFATGQRVATAIAEWLRRHARGLAGPVNRC